VADEDDWLLNRQERGNDATAIPNISGGNLARPLIHGSEYFDRLVDEVAALEPGDYLLFTDWRGDPDERMRDEGPTVAELFGAAAQRGVVVKGLVWRSHLDKLRFSEAENRHLGEHVEAAGGEVLLDQRVRRGGSHHQKFVVLRHLRYPDRDVAFAGGIDLCHSRRDDAEHRGDPQAAPMAKAYGSTPPWHDVQVEVRGPVVGALDRTFRERWLDPRNPDVHNPIAHAVDAFRHADLSAGDLPPLPPDPAPCGPHTIQLLRTYPAMIPPSPYAPKGERSVARGYSKAVRRARRLIYLEDQYMWSAAVARLFARALSENPRLQLVVIVPRVPDQDGALALPPNYVGREQALDVCRQAGPERVHVFDVENHQGTPVYVHAKVCIVDDVWASIGSDNFNRRSWTHDSELSIAVLDPTPDEREPVHPDGQLNVARRFARDLRLRLWREHLDRPDDRDDSDLIDPDEAVEVFRKSAEALQAWYDGGRQGARPPGRVRPHQPERLTLRTKLWAEPVYRLFYDPDGRPWRMRGRQDW
jgi:phosphatidylserine/phosphatidylglycerophosphate/cardiolipin synthase-like enzyme